MTVVQPKTILVAWPDHTQLPETDGSFVQNFQEHPQNILLTDSIQPWLDRLHPDGQYLIGQDSGIYWDLAASLSDEPVRGAKAPDWFYVPGVSPLLEGQFRRSYVLWYERVAPLLLIEFVSGDGAEEHDHTPQSGKFWIYERAIQAVFYAIFDARREQIELYTLVDGAYTSVPANERGHYPVAPLNIELGIWKGTYRNMQAVWLRWWEAQGQLLPTSDERAEQERQRVERLAAMLRSMGVDPDSVA